MHKQSSALQTTLVAGRRAGIVQVSHRVLERPTHVVFCFWSLLLSSSAVEAQYCWRQRSPCVRRRQRCRGPSLLAPKKPRTAAGALAAIQQRCRVYRGPLLLAPKTPMRPSSAALSRPLAARAEDAARSGLWTLTLAPLCSTDNSRHCKLTPAGPLPHTRTRHTAGLS